MPNLVSTTLPPVRTSPMDDLVDRPLPLVPVEESRSASHRHIPALDGIRGIAVLLVLWCHAIGADLNTSIASPLDRLAFTSARLATSGVDLFFVLSGFLITGILYDAKNTNHYFRNFYARRTLRIFPLYYACLFLFVIAIPALAPALSERFGQLQTSSIWYWLYLSNYSQPIMSYLGHPTDHALHVTWSLAVEEQFYLVWPMVVFFLSRKMLLRMCGAMFIFAMLMRAGIWLMLTRPDCWQIALDFTPCKLDVLAVGAAIALIARGPNGIEPLIKPAKFFGPLALVAMLAMIGIMARLGYRGGLITTPGYVLFGSTLCAVMYGALLIWALRAAQTSRMGKFFSAGLFRTFGKYSYAVYLLHLPVMWLAAEFMFTPGAKRIAGTWLPTGVLFCAITSAITLGIAWLSWNGFEKHFLKLKDYFQS